MRAWELQESLNWAIGSYANKAQGMSQKDQSDDYYTLVNADIKKLLSATNKDQRLNVDDPMGGENVIGNRIEKALQHFKQGEYMDPSIVSIGYNGIDFTDGRHRLVAAYRLGEKMAPVLVPTEQVDDFRDKGLIL